MDSGGQGLANSAMHAPKPVDTFLEMQLKALDRLKLECGNATTGKLNDREGQPCSDTTKEGVSIAGPAVTAAQHAPNTQPTTLVGNVSVVSSSSTPPQQALPARPRLSLAEAAAQRKALEQLKAQGHMLGGDRDRTSSISSTASAPALMARPPPTDEPAQRRPSGSVAMSSSVPSAPSTAAGRGVSATSPSRSMPSNPLSSRTASMDPPKAKRVFKALAKIDKEKEQAMAAAFGDLGVLRPERPEQALNDKLSASLDDLDIFGKFR
eukprot:m.75415 g.75415  ORF g.75415 m.75415 type:complete len:266 (-) comp8992_c0_seq2:165-962(-)